MGVAVAGDGCVALCVIQKIVGRNPVAADQSRVCAQCSPNRVEVGNRIQVVGRQVHDRAGLAQRLIHVGCILQRGIAEQVGVC